MLKGKAVITLLCIVVLSSGCVNLDPQTLAFANPMIKKFLDEHPNAEIVVTHLSEEQCKSYEDVIRAECGNPYFQAKEMYRINITDPDSDLYATVWLDWEEKIVECAIKYGTETEVNSPPKPGCTSHAKYDCYKNHVYWYDSCGLVEEKKEYCPNGCKNGVCKESTTCTSHHEYKCYNNHLYWYDSCGNKEDKKEYCEFGCEDNSCILESVKVECSDSDNGKSYNKKGKVTVKDLDTGFTLTVDDYCLSTMVELANDYEFYQNLLNNIISAGVVDSYQLEDDTILLESYCPSDIVDDVNSPFKYQIAYKCPFTCQDGKCISEECTSHHEYKCYNNHLYWYDSCGNKEDKKEHCEFGCEAGACLENEQECIENWVCSEWSECGNTYQSRTCEDTNSCGTVINKPEIEKSCCYDPEGKDIFVKGETKGNYVNGGYKFITYHDTCYQDVMGDSELEEVLKCLAEECYVMEHWAAENGTCESELIICEIGCASGRCVTNISEICYDSDGGQVYGTKGTVTTYSGSTFEDYCDQYGLLHEYYCNDSEDWRVITYPCSNGCEDGECLPE